MEKMRLNIQRFSSCSIGTITQSKDNDNNKSTFSIPATLTTTGNTFNNDDAYMKMQWKYQSSDSWTTISKKTFGISKESDVTKSWSLTLDHKDDGSLEKLNFMVKWYVTSSTNGTSSTKSFTPDDIPRASEIDSITDGTTPYYPTIKWTPKSDDFYYRVYFKNSLGVTVSTGATMYPHQTTQYTYNQLGLWNSSFSGVDSAEQPMTAVLQTENHNYEVIAEKTKTFTATLDTNVKPSVSISNLAEADTTMQSLNWGIYVKGKTKLSYAVNYSFPNPVPTSATITSTTNSESFSSNATINTSMQTKTFTTGFLKTTGSNTITARVTDSRGRYTDATNQTYTVVDYSEPIITTAEAIRVNSNNVADDEGAYVSYKFVGSISSVSNYNGKLFRIGYRVKGSNTSFTYKTISSGYSVNVTSFTRITDWTLSTTNAYEIVFEAIDSFRTSSNPVKATRYLDTGFDLMNFNANGKAMAIGKVSEATGDNKLLEVALPTTFTEYTKINGLYTGRGCIVGTNAGSTSTPYYKFASIKQYGGNSDKNITFKVFTGYGDATTKVGILTAHFRTNGSYEWSSGELKWEYCNSGVANGDYILAYKNVAANGNDAKHVEVELYAKITSGWNLYHFEVICEGQRETRNSDWTLYSTTTGVSSIDSSFTTINSSYGIIKNRNYYSNTLEAYDGRISNANISHYYDNGNAHLKLLLATSSMTSNKPVQDGYILACNWDNSGEWNSQLYLPQRDFYSYEGVITPMPMQLRTCSNGTWNAWQDLAIYKSLYDNSSGTNASITNLSETTANFKYIEIIYRTNDDYQKSVKVYSPNGKKVVLDAAVISGNYTYIKSAQYSISGTSITLESNLSGQARIGNSVATQWDKNSNRIYIIKVLGYR